MRCIKRNEPCQPPRRGTKGTSCKQCAKMHLVCRRSGKAREEVEEEEDEDEEEVVAPAPKRRRVEVVVPVAGPSRQAATPDVAALFGVLQDMATSMGAIARDVSDARADYRAWQKATQVVHVEVGVQSEEEAKASEEKGSEEKESEEKESEEKGSGEKQGEEEEAEGEEEVNV